MDDEYTHVSVILVGKNLKLNNRTGKWARWNVLTSPTKREGRTGQSLKRGDPNYLRLHPSTPPLTVELHMTSEPPKGSPPEIDKETLHTDSIGPIAGGGDLFVYISRHNDKWCFKRRLKKQRRKKIKRQCKKEHRREKTR